MLIILRILRETINMQIYKNIPSKAGVYLIEINGVPYIGASFNMRNRMQKHFSYLRRNTHSNEHLQRSYNLHSNNVSAMTLIELDNPSREELLDYETYFHIQYDSIKNGYNIDLPRKIQSKFTLTEEQVKKAVSLNNKAVIAFDRFTGELVEQFDSVTKAAEFFNGTSSNISRVCKKKLNHIYGQVFCYKADYDLKNNYAYPTHYKKGKTISKEYKAKLRENSSKSKKVFQYDEKMNFIREYQSRRECEELNGVKYDMLRYVLDNGKVKNGYYYYSNKIINNGINS